jgi:hypothetical protein
MNNLPIFKMLAKDWIILVIKEKQPVHRSPEDQRAKGTLTFIQSREEAKKTAQRPTTVAEETA